MMMTVDNGATEFGTNLVKLIAEISHLVCAVFITGNDFIYRVDYDCDIAFLEGTFALSDRRLR